MSADLRIFLPRLSISIHRWEAPQVLGAAPLSPGPQAPSPCFCGNTFISFFSFLPLSLPAPLGVLGKEANYLAINTTRGASGVPDLSPLSQSLCGGSGSSGWVESAQQSTHMFLHSSHLWREMLSPGKKNSQGSFWALPPVSKVALLTSAQAWKELSVPTLRDPGSARGSRPGSRKRPTSFLPLDSWRSTISPQ